jgi:hypothetical protein
VDDCDIARYGRELRGRSDSFGCNILMKAEEDLPRRTGGSSVPGHVTFRLFHH